MTGGLLIDGIDVYSSYGVAVSKDGLNELINFPSPKQVSANEWYEEDGEEADLSGILFKAGIPDIYRLAIDAKILNIQFIVHGQYGKYEDFILLLSNGVYHNFQFTGIDKTYKLRMIDNPNLELAGNIGLFSISFADDFPVDMNYTYASPISTLPPRGGYYLDDVRLSDYGVYVLKGLSEVRRSPALKQSQFSDVNVINGLIYDEFGLMNFRTKDVQLDCLMKASSVSEFWKNYDALFYDLTKSGERKLFVNDIVKELSCYYVGCSTTEFSYSNGIWWRFNLVFRLTKFRVDEIEFLLAAETGELIITEDDYAIDLNLLI